VNSACTSSSRAVNTPLGAPVHTLFCLAVDILLRLKAEGIPRHHTAELGVSGLQSHRIPTRWESVWDSRSKRVGLLGVPSPRYSYPRLGSTLVVVFARWGSSQRQQTRSYLHRFARPVLVIWFPHRGALCFQRRRTLEPPLLGRSATLGS